MVNEDRCQQADVLCEGGIIKYSCNAESVIASPHITCMCMLHPLPPGKWILMIRYKYIRSRIINQ